MNYEKILKISCDFNNLVKFSSTNLQKAIRYDSDMSIVEFSRKIRNADYSKWSEGQKLPTGMDRVDIDSRPLGEHEFLKRNFDYINF